jgi:hypothetical protein
MRRESLTAGLGADFTKGKPRHKLPEAGTKAERRVERFECACGWIEIEAFRGSTFPYPIILTACAGAALYSTQMTPRGATLFALGEPLGKEMAPNRRVMVVSERPGFATLSISTVDGKGRVSVAIPSPNLVSDALDRAVEFVTRVP